MLWKIHISRSRGANNRKQVFKAQYVTEHTEGLDEHCLKTPNTQILSKRAQIVNKVDSRIWEWFTL